MNFRDLGGLRTRDGRTIRPGALARAGWSPDLGDRGYRTVIDLRNDDERAAADPSSVHFPLDGIEDREFWDEWQFRMEFGTPYYYAPFLEHFPGRAARVVAAIADAPSGGVLWHCQGGRDRSGLITLLVLAALDVLPEDIAEDYARSRREPELEALYERAGATPQQVILDLLANLDLPAHLAGVDLPALHARAFS